MGVRAKSPPEEVHWIIVRLQTLYSAQTISILTGVKIRTVQRILKFFHENGTVEPALKKTTSAESSKARKKTILQPWDKQMLFSIVDQNPDLYLDELQNIMLAYTRKDVSVATIWRTLNRGGYTLKKLTKVAAERSKQKRTAFLARIGQYQPHQLVFVDESSVDRRTTYRTRARSRRGIAASRKAFFVRGRRFSVLPAISLSEGILHCDIVEGSFCTQTFYNFVSGLLEKMQPYPGPNSVLVLDNCKIHKHPAIQELIASRGVRCVFLPPYSPDFNPIELAFSAMKYHLRRDGAYVRFAMTEMSDSEIFMCIMKALYSITAKDCEGWYRHCGYF